MGAASFPALLRGQGDGRAAGPTLARQRAEEALKDRGAAMDMAEAQAELARAVAQLRMIQKLRKGTQA